MNKSFPISDETWLNLVKANKDDWARPGVFATAVGCRYQHGQPGSLLYVGKSPGPKGDKVGSTHDQSESAQKSLAWMIDRKNHSAFWSFIDCIAERDRDRIAWTNLCKMDRKKGSDKPPKKRQWQKVASPSIAALAEEIADLDPQVTLFVTGARGFYTCVALELLESLGYQPIDKPPVDATVAKCFRTPRGKFAVVTPHPGAYAAHWPHSERNRVIEMTKVWLSGGA